MTVFYLLEKILKIIFMTNSLFRLSTVLHILLFSVFNLALKQIVIIEKLLKNSYSLY